MFRITSNFYKIYGFHLTWVNKQYLYPRISYENYKQFCPKRQIRLICYQRDWKDHYKDKAFTNVRCNKDIRRENEEFYTGGERMRNFVKIWLNNVAQVWRLSEENGNRCILSLCLKFFIHLFIYTQNLISYYRLSPQCNGPASSLWWRPPRSKGLGTGSQVAACSVVPSSIPGRVYVETIFSATKTPLVFLVSITQAL